MVHTHYNFLRSYKVDELRIMYSIKNSPQRLFREQVFPMYLTVHRTLITIQNNKKFQANSSKLLSFSYLWDFYFSYYDKTEEYQ